MDDNGNGALIPLHASVQWASGAEKSRRETEQREIRKVEEELEKAFHFSADSDRVRDGHDHGEVTTA